VAEVKVAHLTTVDSSLQFLLLPQLRAVSQEGGEVIGISAPGTWVPALEGEGIRHVPLENSTRQMNVVADARAARELWRILRRERVDILHTHNPKPGLYGRVIGRLAGVPIVVNTVHGVYASDRDRRAKRLFVYGLEALASRFSDAELFQNPEDFDLFWRFRLVPRARMRLLGNGIDLDRFDPSRFTDRDRRLQRNRLGIVDGQIVVGTVGRLVAEKGYPELFAAMEQLGEEFVLVVVGPSDEAKSDRLPSELLERAREAGVRFLGHRDDVDALYGAFDIFVLASHREGYPRAAMEAAAMGLPIVATDIRGCRQVVARGVTGLLVPVGDPNGLAAAVRWLGAHADQRADMGRAARLRARDTFDERAVVEIVMRTYAEVAARKRVTLL
jgi:glycosyltransferase involved in cell wall biosynthesis